MKTYTTATFENGQLILDRPLDLPERSRVSVIVETISESADARRAAWASLRQRVERRPVHSGGRRFTRDELHERR